MLIRAILFTEDITEQDVRFLPHYYIVQNFDYEVSRYRNAKGTPYDLTQPVTLSFTLRQTTGIDAKEFYNRLQSTASNSVSILFDTNVNNVTARVEGYESAVLFRGYIVDVEEFYDADINPHSAAPEQLLIHVKLLADHITYIGVENNATLTIFEN